MNTYIGSTVKNMGFNNDYDLYVLPVINEILDGITACRYWSDSIDQVLMEIYFPYFDGQDAFDACYDRMMNQLNLYITE